LLIYKERKEEKKMSTPKEPSFLQDLFEANIKLLLIDLDKIIENQDRREYRENLLNEFRQKLELYLKH